MPQNSKADARAQAAQRRRTFQQSSVQPKFMKHALQWRTPRGLAWWRMSLAKQKKFGASPFLSFSGNFPQYQRHQCWSASTCCAKQDYMNCQDYISWRSPREYKNSEPCPGAKSRHHMPILFRCKGQTTSLQELDVYKKSITCSSHSER